MCGKIVLKPSNPACPALSVTPGLNPTVIAISGGFWNNFLLLINDLLRVPNSIIGSANKSYITRPASSSEISDFT